MKYRVAFVILVASAGAVLLSAPRAVSAAPKHAPAPKPPAARSDDLTPRFPPNSVILFQGDSITDGGRGRDTDPNHVFGQDYTYLIAADCGGHFPDSGWTFYNRGVGGNKVTDLAARWQTDTLALKPNILSILIGVNDAASVVNSNGSGGVSAQQFEQVYDTILQQATAANPNLTLVLCEPFIEPVGHVEDNPPLWNAEIKARQAAVERLAAKYHAPVVHFQAAIDNAIRRSHRPISYWVWDGIHPTYAGHRLMADEWIRTVNRLYSGGTAARR